jgi:hypothetical protein
MTVRKLYTVGTASELYIADKVCGSGQAVRQWASYGCLGKLWVLGQAWVRLGIRTGVGTDLPVAHRRCHPRAGVG